MKKKFAQPNKPKAEISTASLPDIIFILLFFFMVTTILRTTDQKVITQLPEAEQLQKQDKDPTVIEIKVGPALDRQQLGEGYHIQIENRLVRLDEVSQLVLQQKAAIPEYLQDQMIISLRIDENTDMGIIVDLQQSLRKINARRIIYNSIKENQEI
jgi:biopolymer transport protein ExbD